MITLPSCYSTTMREGGYTVDDLKKNDSNIRSSFLLLDRYPTLMVGIGLITTGTTISYD